MPPISSLVYCGDIGDISQVLAEIAPRRILIAAGVGGASARRPLPCRPCPAFSVEDPRILTDWIGE